MFGPRHGVKLRVSGATVDSPAASRRESVVGPIGSHGRPLFRLLDDWSKIRSMTHRARNPQNLDETPVHRVAPAERRAVAVHYVVACLLSTAYAIQICPFVESLRVHQMLVPACIVFSCMFVVRSIWRASYRATIRRGLTLDLCTYLLGALVLAAYCQFVFGFPLDSGIKLLTGVLVLAWFGSLDIALHMEYSRSQNLYRTRTDLPWSTGTVPFSGKLAAFTATSVFIVAVVLSLVFVNDIAWLRSKQGSAPLADLGVAVLIEISFIVTAILAYSMRVVYSYSRNVNFYLHQQTDALNAVASGDLSVVAVAASNDEFGDMARLTNSMILSLRKANDDLAQSRDATILALSSLAETRDDETGAHIVRTQRYVRALAEELATRPKFRESLDGETVDTIVKSSPLHDIGKVGIPDAILRKPGPLTDEEFEAMKRHTTLGANALNAAAQILGQASFLGVARQIVVTHHERWDGTGYPAGLAGEEIPIGGRLMAVADVYDALTTRRVYKPAMPHEEAREIIVEGRGRHFDPDIVDAFLAVEQTFIEIGQTNLECPNLNEPLANVSELEIAR